jgi:glyoxylase-like metal-dependent hydrolase (beta-lactamase superfamily II)
MNSVVLPPSMQVLERGWLSSNNILFFSGNDNDAGVTLVDSGYAGMATQTLQLLKSVLVGRHLPDAISRLINTHSHSDHIGGNAAVKREYGSEILIPVGIEQHIEHWNEEALLLSPAGQVGERFIHDGTLSPGTTVGMGGLSWQVLAVPGHDMDALAFYCPDKRILISGDALWQDGFGIVFGELLGDPDALPATRRTLEMISRLAIDVVIPGHGKPFDDVEGALARAFRRLEAFESDTARLARNALRACFTFNLLDLQRLRLDELPSYLEGIPFFVTARKRISEDSGAAFAEWLLADLLRARAIAIEDGWIVPKMAA